MGFEISEQYDYTSTKWRSTEVCIGLQTFSKVIKNLQNAVIAFDYDFLNII